MIKATWEEKDLSGLRISRHSSLRKAKRGTENHGRNLEAEAVAETREDTAY